VQLVEISFAHLDVDSFTNPMKQHLGKLDAVQQNDASMTGGTLTARRCRPS
jgi:hypothetical protein